MLLITINVNSYQFKAYATIIGRIIKNDSDKTDDVNNTGTNTTVLVGHRMSYWIPKYIFHTFFDTFPKARFLLSGIVRTLFSLLQANRVLTVSLFLGYFSSHEGSVSSLDWNYQSSILIAGLYLFPY